MNKPIRIGRPPIHGQAMTPTERKQRQREEIRRKEREAQQAAFQEQQRQMQLAKDCRKAVGMMLKNLGMLNFTGKLNALGYTETDADECRAQIDKIIQALSEGRDRIP